MTKIPRQTRRHLREEGGAGSVSAEFCLMSTTVAASTMLVITGFATTTEQFFVQTCDAIEQSISQQVDPATACPSADSDAPATP